MTEDDTFDRLKRMSLGEALEMRTHLHRTDPKFFFYDYFAEQYSDEVCFKATGWRLKELNNVVHHGSEDERG